MSLLDHFIARLPHATAYAHCDVPCGIYDPKPAQIAAATVLKMVEKITALSADDTSFTTRNNFVRMVWTKEEHARKCKEELLILWTDYFKPEHLENFPNLHDIFWQAAKLCSTNKQSVDIVKAQALVTAVDEIADIFNKTKKA
jgi:nickel superoxide dismutase